MHPATEKLMRWFNSDHLQKGFPKTVFDECGHLALWVSSLLPEDPEVTAGLRKLLEAKDCFVRAAIRHQETQDA